METEKINIYHLNCNGKYAFEFGTGRLLCEVIEYDDGQVVAKWRGKKGKSLVIYSNLDEFKKISVNEKRYLSRVTMMK